MNKYQLELSRLKKHDEIQGSYKINDYDFITTAGHGYLVIPVEDKNYDKAIKICDYGYKGNHAIYLEEDCEAREFLTAINQ